MKKITYILFILIWTFTKGFSQSDTNIIVADHFHTSNFDVAIFPATYFGIIGGQPFTPTRQEVEKTEIALKKNLKLLNKDLVNQFQTPVIHKNLNNYKRQYFGRIDNKGQHILVINCFWKREPDEIINNWLKEMISVCDGGSYFWNIKYNLDTGELFDLNVNGTG